MNGSDPSIWSKRFAGLLEDFIKMSSNVSRFRGDAQVKAKIQKLKATDRTRDPKHQRRIVAKFLDNEMYRR